MRKIKFRFWSGTKMFKDLENVLECLKQQLAFNNDVIGMTQYDHSGIHKASFMQYTDLKDKNGIEIYEGDIIKQHGVIANKQIVFKNGGFRVANSKSSSGLKNNLLNKQRIHKLNLEVIGNIYENPKLLNQKK